MSNYTGVRCPACNKKFAASDDVVVCPICGAPHHRACYAARGECVFAADHISGKEWSNPDAVIPPEPPRQSEPGEPDAGLRQCGRCASANPADAIFCQVCGSNLNAREQEPQSYQIPVPDPYGGIKRDETIAEIPVADLASYVGPNAGYYLPRFYAFDKAGSHIIPNLSAFFFTHFYCFYRKMYAVGAVLLGFYLLRTVPLFLLANEIGLEAMLDVVYGISGQSYGAQAGFFLKLFNVFSVLHTVLRFGLLLLGNHLYYSHSVSKVRSLSQSEVASEGLQSHQQVLSSAGGVDQLSTIVLIGIIFLGTGAIFSLFYF